jgi:hypothetical protein
MLPERYVSSLLTYWRHGRMVVLYVKRPGGRADAPGAGPQEVAPVNEPDPNHAGRQALLEVPAVPALDAETVAAEDRLFDAVEPVLDAWMLARDNVVEELERRAGQTMFPPGGLDRALEALSRLARAELAARTELARLLVELGHGG